MDNSSVQLKCPSCSNELVGRPKFCIKCGNNLLHLYQSLESPSNQPPETWKPPPTTPRKQDLNPVVTPPPTSNVSQTSSNSNRLSRFLRSNSEKPLPSKSTDSELVTPDPSSKQDGKHTSVSNSTSFLSKRTNPSYRKSSKTKPEDLQKQLDKAISEGKEEDAALLARAMAKASKESQSDKYEIMFFLISFLKFLFL